MDRLPASDNQDKKSNGYLLKIASLEENLPSVKWSPPDQQVR
jgi:hypothetical protein